MAVFKTFAVVAAPWCRPCSTRFVAPRHRPKAWKCRTTNRTGYEFFFATLVNQVIEIGW